ncbi:APC family permease [Mesomycoplasma lagogenitalium]|uniref:APC family permease n=1 Tax=Mesomycoplasma lagogenitalium TaxID=171286 RepID=A0ABY8LT14_9BACT|nr:APC family permease [Mesomycoplasma lagogenitalium]WGI36384.1 APC family permease [Mesomycoplasma lagogenitalium]
MKNKLSEKQFWLFGLNYIIGFGFVVTIAGIVSKGLWGILIFAITAFIGFSIMLVFARGTQNYPTEVGGSYAYAKKAFPKQKWFIFLQGWNQFAVLPLSSASAPLFFSELFSAFDKEHQSIYQISSVIFFLILILIGTLGIKLSKWVILLIAAFKWIIIGLGFILVIWFSFTQLKFGENILKPTSEISIVTIIATIQSFVYAFAGAEGLAGLSSEVKTKRFKKILMSIFIVVLTFYFIFYLIFLGIDANVLKDTSTASSFGVIFNLAFGTTGLILFAIGILFQQSASQLTTLIYYARTIAPLAEDGYLPKYLAKKAKNGEYKRALYFIAIFAIISMIIFTFIPSLFNVKDQFNAVLYSYIVVFYMQYILTIISILAIGYKNKEFKVPIWEQVIYYLSMLLMGFLVLVAFIPSIIGKQWEFSNIVLMPSYLGILLFGYLIWGSYIWINKVIKKKRSKNYIH